MIIFKIHIDRDINLEQAADIVNKIHRLIILDLGIDEGMASPVRVEYNIISKDIMQEGNIKP